MLNEKESKTLEEKLKGIDKLSEEEFLKRKQEIIEEFISSQSTEKQERLRVIQKEYDKNLNGKTLQEKMIYITIEGLKLKEELKKSLKIREDAITTIKNILEETKNFNEKQFQEFERELNKTESETLIIIKNVLMKMKKKK